MPPPAKKERKMNKWEKHFSLYTVVSFCFNWVSVLSGTGVTDDCEMSCGYWGLTVSSGRRASALNSWAIAQALIFYSFNSSGCLTSTEEYSSLLLSKTILRLVCVIVYENFFMSCIKYDSFSSLLEFARRKGQYSISHMQSTHFCGKYLSRLPCYFYFVSYGGICLG